MTTLRVDPSSLVTPLATVQHKAGLWAQADQQVFAVVMGHRVPGLPTRLAAADVAAFDCLLPGALEPQTTLDAPYLVQLRPVSGFTDWLLFEAAASLGEWGVLVRSPARLIVLRNHLRGLLQALLPGGQRIRLDWMDPAVMRAVLPLAGPSDLTAFFGPVRSLVVPGARAWQHADLQMGRLVQRDIPVLQTE
ncbi:DUF4123 domain-containing protein [Variovorax ginsengisoli]|uniref:DUF4123 domain-containing protein n=1 Tax=Variovorax ginsengisoli TaxID=363844 RepID=A0ABT9S9K0_9BURK|nr:DUF4123 domain-containing protein [Variovorax ginsengisoli]MDP9901035.1 hypothetical protein [Variovorax ginsengisoli]